MPKLRAVSPGEKPPSKPKTLTEALSGTERDLMVALLDKLTAEVDRGVPAHTLPALSKQIRELRRELEAMDSADGQDDIGDAAGTPDAAFDPEAL